MAKAGSTIPRHCDYEVDYTVEELLALKSYMDQLEEGGKGLLFPEIQADAITNVQSLLRNMEKRMLYSYKIPLGEETRKAFKKVAEPATSIEAFGDPLNGVFHALLYDMLNNYCSCKASGGH
jgi:hypothetical protein